MAFGSSLTKVAALPEGAVRKQEDPFADKKSRWPSWILLILVLLGLVYLLSQRGFVSQWTCGLVGQKPPMTQAAPGTATQAPAK
jgi:hypothetical protein